jgi:3-deoxy-D-manno-octulosonic-acid transferase
MPRWIYSLALRSMLPFALLSWLLRGWRNAAYRGDIREVLALSMRARADHPLWLHAASVGEVQALAGLLKGLVQQPGLPLLLTVSTPTGVSRARELYRDLLQPQAGGEPCLSLQLAPWDLPGVVARFMRATQPRAAVFIETELWPNLLAGCRQLEVPVVLVSARLSERSLHRYLRFARRLMVEVVRIPLCIAAQTAVDRARFMALGAQPDRVTVSGNLKFDLPLPAEIGVLGVQLRARWAQGRPLWVAGSTHDGEEAICLEAHRQLLAVARRHGKPLPMLVLAPRRSERFDAVARWLASQNLRFTRIAQGAVAMDGAEVLLLDSMGQLLQWYAAADVAFVGGSLVPVGGHNLLEPAALGKPVIAGPHCFNAPAAAEQLAQADALITVSGSAELIQALSGLFGDPVMAMELGVRAAGVVAANRGAAAGGVALIATLPAHGRVTAPEASA